MIKKCIRCDKEILYSITRFCRECNKELLYEALEFEKREEEEDE